MLRKEINDSNKMTSYFHRRTKKSVYSHEIVVCFRLDVILSDKLINSSELLWTI